MAGEDIAMAFQRQRETMTSSIGHEGSSKDAPFSLSLSKGPDNVFGGAQLQLAGIGPVPFAADDGSGGSSEERSLWGSVVGDSATVFSGMPLDAVGAVLQKYGFAIGGAGNEFSNSANFSGLPFLGDLGVGIGGGTLSSFRGR